MNVKFVASVVAFAAIATTNMVTAAPAQASFWDDLLRTGARVILKGAATELEGNGPRTTVNNNYAPKTEESSPESSRVAPDVTSNNTSDLTSEIEEF